MTTSLVLLEVRQERHRQEQLRREGRFTYTLATPDGMDDGEKLAALMEEVGEVARAILGDHDIVQDGGDVRKELIHVAAVAVAWAESLR
jgi:NTP pyrophosphatase (non-canonical NTP hydrolase)